MKIVTTVVVGLLMAAAVPSQQVAGWGEELSHAMAQAEQSGKDVLVVCVDFERDSWSRELRDRVLSQAAFQTQARERFELVALHARRDAAALAKLGALRVATCALVSAAGDVYGRLRYSVHGPDGYLRRLDGARKQRAAVIAARARVDALLNVGLESLPEAVMRSVERLELATSAGSVPAATMLAEGLCRIAAKHGDEACFAERLTLRVRLSRAVLGAGYTCSVVDRWVRRADPANASGLLELTMVPAMRSARSDASAHAALARLDTVSAFGFRDATRMKPILASAVRLAAGRLRDPERAAHYAELQKQCVVR